MEAGREVRVGGWDGGEARERGALQPGWDFSLAQCFSNQLWEAYILFCFSAPSHTKAFVKCNKNEN